MAAGPGGPRTAGLSGTVSDERVTAGTRVMLTGEKAGALHSCPVLHGCPPFAADSASLQQSSTCESKALYTASVVWSSRAPEIALAPVTNSRSKPASIAQGL